MAKGRAVAIVLEAVEKSELTALTRKHGAPQALAERADVKARIRTSANRTWRRVRGQASDARRGRGAGRAKRWRLPMALLAVGVAGVVVVFVLQRRRR